MKKLVIAVVAAAALNTVSAQSCASAFSGFYAGLQAGLNATVAEIKTDSTKSTASAQSFIGGLFAGYGMGVGSCAYVGGELYVNFNNTNSKAEDNDPANTVTTTLKNTYNFGAKLRLGYTVSQQAMIFLGLGIESSRWQYKANATVAGVAQPEYKKNKTSAVFAPSVGMEMFMNKNLFVRGEYTCAFGPRMKVGNTDNVKINANQHRFTLGLGYKF